MAFSGETGQKALEVLGIAAGPKIKETFIKQGMSEADAQRALEAVLRGSQPSPIPVYQPEPEVSFKTWVIPAGIGIAALLLLRR